MAERRRGIAIRLGLQDAEVVKRALEALGRDGQAALRRIEEAAKAPTSSLRALNTVSGEVQSTMAATASRIGPVGVALTGLGPAGIAAGAGLAAIAGALSGGLSVTRELETLQASLETVTGSVSAADRAFAQIQDFAVETPFSLQEVTSAFIKLKALGLDPSEAALRSYGNTSSAMSKSLDQMIEAVADAATGEFERLKEFGIRARSEGDQVTFTFRGISTTVRKEASAIEGYLRRLGEVEFAGAMERQATRLNSQLGNLTDAWRLFLAEIANVSGARSAAGGFLEWLTEAANRARRGLASTTELSRQVVAVGRQIRTVEDELAQFRAMGMTDSDPEVASRLPILEKLRAEEAKLIGEARAETDAAGADAAREKAEADAKATSAAEARAAAIKGVTDSQRRELELARMAADQRAEATAADKAEADLRKAASDASAEEIAAARARAVEVVRAERATADAARAVADAQREKEQATKKAATEMKRAREEAERAAAADAKAIRNLRDELALLNAGTPDARQQLERGIAVRDARESVGLPENRDEAGQLAGDLFDAEQREKMRQAGRQVFDETRTAAEQYAARLDHLHTLVRSGAIDQDTYARATAAAKEEMRRAEAGAGDLSTALLGGVGHAIMGLRNNFENFGEVAISVLQHVILELIRMQEAAKAAGKAGPLSDIIGVVSGALGFLGGGGGWPSGMSPLPGPSGVPGGVLGGGFQHGGSFRVGGGGGVDSQVVAFRATPGERVDVSTPASASAMSGGRGGQPVAYYSIDARGATDPALVEAAVERALSLHEPRIVRQSVQAVKADQRRG